jgi:hypothetical protein
MGRMNLPLLVNGVEIKRRTTATSPRTAWGKPNQESSPWRSASSGTINETTPRVSSSVTMIAASHSHHSRRSARLRLFHALSDEGVVKSSSLSDAPPLFCTPIATQLDRHSNQRNSH